MPFSFWPSQLETPTHQISLVNNQLIRFSCLAILGKEDKNHFKNALLILAIST